MSIKDWEAHDLRMDYSSMYKGKHPSDIDLFYLGENEVAIFGEIKNESYDKEKWEHQKGLYQSVIDNYNKEVLWLFVVHNKYWQNGDRVVDVPNCLVKEYCYKKPNYKSKWVTPRKPTRVKEVLAYYGLTN